MAKPVICTHCGATTHDARNCRDISSFATVDKDFTAADSKVAGPLVRCMSCNMFGHVMCQTLPPVPAASAGLVAFFVCLFVLFCFVNLFLRGGAFFQRPTNHFYSVHFFCNIFLI